MISFMLYNVLKMKRCKANPMAIYRITRSGQIIISENIIDCALGICSPSLYTIYYNFIKEEIPPTLKDQK